MMKTDLHARLIDAAMTLLAEDHAEVTLRAVARAAGVSAMAPYRHFEDKAALLGAVTREGFDRLREVLVAVDAAQAGVAAVEAQGLAYLDFALANPALFRLMFASELDKPPTPATLDGTAYGVLARRVATLVAPERAREATTAAWSIVHGLATLMLDRRLPPDRAHAAAVLRLFAEALGR